MEFEMSQRLPNNEQQDFRPRGSGPNELPMVQLLENLANKQRTINSPTGADSQCRSVHIDNSPPLIDGKPDRTTTRDENATKWSVASPGQNHMGANPQVVSAERVSPSTSEKQTASTEYLTQLIADIPNPLKREFALQELGKHRESYHKLAPCLWYSFGTIAAFLQEIISVYPSLSPPTLSEAQSHRVCNCLALLQCIASHEETRPLCLRANIPLYLYPFLNSVSKHRSLEYLRLTALGVIGALIKGEDSQVLSFLLRTEIVPLCLRIMDGGSELSKTVATFIVQRILIHEKGLSYLCATPERFYAVSSVLANTLTNQNQKPRTRLVKHVIRCYLRLCDDAKARLAFKHCLPECLKNGSLEQHCREDPVIQTWLTQLQTLVAQTPPPPPPSGGDSNPYRDNNDNAENTSPRCHHMDGSLVSS